MNWRFLTNESQEVKKDSGSSFYKSGLVQQFRSFQLGISSDKPAKVLKPLEIPKREERKEEKIDSLAKFRERLQQLGSKKIL